MGLNPEGPDPGRPSAASLPRAGDQLGDFRIEERIGRGAVGTVFRASQRSLGDRPVALKVLPTDLSSASDEKRFRREARAAAELHHECLAEIYGFGREGPWRYYAMRLVEGPSLQAVLERLRREPSLRTAPETRRILVRQAASIAEALSVVHAAGLVHRDVKPANIVLRGGTIDGPTVPDEPGVLVDFGLVRSSSDSALTRSGHVVATMAYAPPEQLLGGHVDPRTDLFSLGVTLHDLLAGRLPEDRSQASTGLEPLTQLVQDIEPDLAAVVAKATDPLPGWRYQEARELVADLNAWLAGCSVSARRPPVGQRLHRWARRHPALLLRGLSFSAVLIGTVLLAGRVGRYAAAAGRADRACEAGELLRMSEASRELPWWAVGLFLRDAEAVELAERIRAREPADPVPAILDPLEAGDPSRALLAAATYIRQNGPGSDPAVTRFFERSLLAEAGAQTGPAATATTLAARLFYERPDSSPADRAESAPLRRALLTLWDRRDLSSDQRLLLLTALSGAGTSHDVGWLVHWAIGQQDLSESQRLAFCSAERILRRAHGCGGLESIDYASLIADLVAVAPRLGPSHARSGAVDYPGWSPSWSRQNAALRDLVVATALAHRAAGRPFEEREPLVALPLDRTPLPGWRLDGSFVTVAACADRRVGRALTSPALLGSRHGAREWGWACGIYADDAVSRSAREACATSGREAGRSETLLSAFDAGLREGALECRGERRDLLLDEDTLLGAEPPAPALTPIPLRRDLETPRGLMARWDLAQALACVSGAAVDAAVTAASFGPDSTGSCGARLAAPGRAIAQFDFVSSGPASGRSWQLGLEHCAASRRYHPYQGVAWLDIRVDGVLLRTLRASEETECKEQVPLPTDLLGPGRHRITVHLRSATTTVYWLRALELRSGG